MMTVETRAVGPGVEARKRATPATSSGVPRRPRGILATRALSSGLSASRFLLMGVEMAPGAMLLTVML